MWKLNKFPESVDNRIIELRQDWLIIMEIQSRLVEELDFKVSFGYIQKICKQIKDTSTTIDKWLNELNKIVDDDKFYEVQNDYYIFYKDKEKFPVAVTTIDNIFKDYSKFGGNMTWDEVMSKYKLKSEVWSLIKSRLKLYKTSNIVSPYTLENMTDEQADKYIEWGVELSMQDKYKRTFERKHKAIKDREFKKYSNYYHQQQEFLKQLDIVLKKYDPRKLSKYELKKIPEVDNNDTIDVSFSDLHMGKQWTDWIVSRIYKMTNYLINRPEKNINLLFLWDLIESIAPWGMHPDQERHMELHWFDLIMLTVKIVENMLIELFKAGKEINFYGVGGNHDRLGQSNIEDPDRTAALVIYEMISRGVSNTDVKVHILRENINTLYLEQFNYIVMHWEKNDSQKAHNKAEAFLRNHITKNRSKGNIILHWDKHHLDLDEVKDTDIVWVPSLAWQWEFDKKIDVHSKPWYIIIKRNDDWQPDILIKRLK